MRRNDSEVIERMTALIRAQVGGRPRRSRHQPAVIRTSFSKAHLRAIALVLGVGMALSLAYLILGTPREQTLTRTQPTPAGRSSLEPMVMLVVHVAGDVHQPGVVSLPIGSRVVDAINAAGGVLAGADTTTVNLARLVEDGEQILVGKVLSQGPDRIDLNTSSADELDRLPGIGPVIAQRIIDWRQEHGRFRSVDDLKDVSGVGAATFASIRKLVVVR